MSDEDVTAGDGFDAAVLRIEEAIRESNGQAVSLLDAALVRLDTAIKQSNKINIRVARLEISVRLLWLVVSVATSAWVVGFIVGRLTSG